MTTRSLAASIGSAMRALPAAGAPEGAWSRLQSPDDAARICRIANRTNSGLRPPANGFAIALALPGFLQALECPPHHLTHNASQPLDAEASRSFPREVVTRECMVLPQQPDHCRHNFDDRQLINRAFFLGSRCLCFTSKKSNC